MASLADERAFVIDDDPDIRALMVAYLSSLGWRAQTHDSGFGLAVALRNYQPQIIFVDIHMPGLSGSSALGAALNICGLSPRPKIFVISAGSPQELSRAVALLGADGALRKPIKHQDLEACLEIVGCDDWPSMAVGD